MLKIFFAAIVAIGLIATGSILLISIKHQQHNIKPHVVIDFEPYCDEDAYLNVGNSEDDIATYNILKNLSLNVAEKSNTSPDNELFLTIEDGQTLHSILRPKKVSEQEIALLGMALNPHLQVRDLAFGDLYQLTLVDVSATESLVESFVIKKLDPNRVPITYKATRQHKNLGDAQFLVETHTPPVVEERALIELTVKGTLYQTFGELPFGNELMQRLLGVFAWQMRMPEDVAPGDKIEILALKKFALGEFIGYGKIQSVYYRQSARTRFATFFTSQDKKIQGFFDETGASLEKEFAYSPVFDTTATSNQNSRMHPIRKIRIAHNGIDYRGTIGTPFFSIADGEVIEKRFDKNVGNMIRIRHKYGVHSEYFHADSLDEKLTVGSRVKRGQKLGGIGRTGRLCTGPHLHMGLYRMNGENRKYITLGSLRKTLQPAMSIDAAHKTEFNRHVQELTAFMQTKSGSVVATTEKK